MLTALLSRFPRGRGCGPESTYHYIGAERRADPILSGGVNVWPAEVDPALVRAPGVDDAVAIGLHGDDMGKTVHAIIARPAMD